MKKKSRRETKSNKKSRRKARKPRREAASRHGPPYGPDVTLEIHEGECVARAQVTPGPNETTEWVEFYQIANGAREYIGDMDFISDTSGVETWEYWFYEPIYEGEEYEAEATATLWQKGSGNATVDRDASCDV